MRRPPWRRHALRFRSGQGRSPARLCRRPPPQMGTNSSQSPVYWRAELSPLRSPYATRPHDVQQLFEVWSKASVRAKIQIPRSFSPAGALAQDSGQLTESQADKFGHPVGAGMGFPQGVSEDAVVTSKGLLLVGNLSLCWGKSCYTHAAAMSQTPDSQHRLQEHGWGGSNPLY